MEEISCKWEIVFIVTSLIAFPIVYLWSCISQSHDAALSKNSSKLRITFNAFRPRETKKTTLGRNALITFTSLPIFRRYEDLKNALLDSDSKKIQCAFIRGCIRAKNLKIYDWSMREGVIRQYTVDEVYDIGNPDGSIKEEKFHYVNNLETVEFGLSEQDGYSWLIDEIIPTAEFESAMTQTRCDTERFSTFHAPGYSSRQLKRVTTTVHMLVIGEPITVMGAVWINSFGYIQFGRPTAGFPYYPDVMVSRMSPESLNLDTEKTKNFIKMGFAICAILGGTGTMSLIRKFLLYIQEQLS